jgi:FkbM family methyltransferase
MTSGPKVPAHSDRYGRQSLLERLGARLGRLIGDGPVRQLLRGGFRRVLGWTTGGGPRSVLPHGEVVRIAPAYRFLTWNPVEYEAFRGVLRPGDTALDVGANVGAYALLFGQWVGSTGRVIAFEPAPDAYRGLARHVALNGLAAVVETRQAAVSDRVGEAEFVSQGWAGTNHLTARGAGGGRIIRVPTTTVDAVCAERGIRPRLLKIDVEGAELAVLRGARQTIARMGDDGMVFVEMHPGVWRDQGLTAADIINELAAQGLHAVPLRTVDDAWSLDGECMRLERI